MKRSNVLGLVACVLVTFAAAAVGSLASIRADQFYRELVRPHWAPPANVFGPVWTVLYCCMAGAAWLVWREGFMRHRTALAVYVVQLVLNALWSWIFFAWREGRWAFVEVLLLWAAILLTIALFWRIRKLAALLLAPYFLWVSFAALLTFAVWQRNPHLLS